MSSLNFLFEITVRIHASEPVSHLRFERALDLNYRITFDDAVAKKQQVIEIRNGLEMSANTVVVQDLDGDGFLDLKIPYAIQADGVTLYKVLFFEPGPRDFRFVSGEGFEKLRRISKGIETEMKAQGIWSAQRDDSHPQISTPSDWIQWDYLPVAVAAAEAGALPEAYGAIRIFDYVGREFGDAKFSRFCGLLKSWDEAFAEYAAPLLAKIPKLFDKVVIEWVVPIAVVNEAFEAKFEELRKNIKLPGYKIGEAPLEMIREKYVEQVRERIAMPLTIEQSKVAMRASGYDFETLYPLPESDLQSLKPNAPFSIRLTFHVPIEA